MSDTEFDVIIAAYLIPDLAQDEFGYLPDMAKLHANLMRFGGLEGKA